jgi:pyruvate kinase
MKLEKLENELSKILVEIIDSEHFIDAIIVSVHETYKLSAKNFLRYLILRSKDLRKYHGTLSDLGVSSLRSSEGYVFSNLYSVVKNINLIRNTPFNLLTNIDKIGYTNSKKLIKKNARSLFPSDKKSHFTQIMVTLPDEAANDKNIIKNMALNGMEIARINLSHGDLEQWQNMVNFIKEVEKEIDQSIRIYMDLSGPKLRTSKINYIHKNGKTKKSIPVTVGEFIMLTKNDLDEKTIINLKENEDTKIVPVLLNQVIDDAKIGDFILFDDGMIKSKVISKTNHNLELEITECYKDKLGSFKGINLPNTKLNLPALTKKDIKDLSFVCKHADIIGYSFVRTADDVHQLYSELSKYNAENIGIVFKIENKEAFENIPEIILKGMERTKIGVMIARGDLAVEIGFERISEVQNEILWLCEAAHIPVIWATQVLENLAKTGIPTRAEISDAGMAVRADCVMLNKGPSILQAIKVLKNILIRMEGHSFKKKDEQRSLNVAKQYFEKLKN